MLAQSSDPQCAVKAVAPAPRVAIRYRPITELKLDPANPRIHSKKQIRQIAASITAFGFNVPILIDAHSKVVAGHGRVLACIELGVNEVPTICLEHLTSAQAKAFLIADNRLTENAGWDQQLLAQQLQELCAAELDFSLEAIGFEMGEIDLLIESLSPAPDGADDPADALPTDREPAVTQAGDLWLLGSHRLYCGNALEQTSYATLLGERKAGIVFTDPPYNVPIAGHVSGNGALQHREFAMAAGEMSESQFTEFLRTLCRLLAQHSGDGSMHYVCMDWRHLPEILTAGRSVYTELKNVCIWAKDNAGLGSLYRSQHELILVWKHGTGSHHNNIQLGQFGRNRSNVWHYPGVNSFGRNSEEGNLLALHPTVKPVALVADALLDCSARADIVLDPFLGSGTTLIAAERSGRCCYGMELDPLYVDTAIRRWQSFTGLKARQAVSGERFDDLQQSRNCQAEVGHD